MSTPEEKLNSPTHSGPSDEAKSGSERWRVEKIEGKRVDLVQEVET